MRRSEGNLAETRPRQQFVSPFCPYPFAAPRLRIEQLVHGTHLLPVRFQPSEIKMVAQVCLDMRQQVAIENV